MRPLPPEELESRNIDFQKEAAHYLLKAAEEGIIQEQLNMTTA